MKRDENGVPIPETALPWSKDDHQGINGSPCHWVTTSASFLWSDDREFAIHAANCFPQLVAALKAGKAYADALGNYSERAGKVIDGVKSLDDLFEDWQEKQDAALEAAKGGAK